MSVAVAEPRRAEPERIGAILFPPQKPPASACSKCGGPRQPMRLPSGGWAPWHEPCPNPDCYPAPPEDDATRRAREAESEEGQTRLGIPSQYHGAAFRDCPEWHRELEEYYGGLGRGGRGGAGLLTVLGICGSGKTRLGYAFARQCHRHGRPWRMGYTERLLEQWSWIKGNAELDQLCAFAGLLILDDLLAGTPTDRQVRLVEILVHEREIWGRPTVTTTNLSLDQIAKWTERTASRLASGRVLQLPDVDWRLRGATHKG